MPTIAGASLLKRRIGYAPSAMVVVRNTISGCKEIVRAARTFCNRESFEAAKYDAAHTIRQTPKCPKVVKVFKPALYFRHRKRQPERKGVHFSPLRFALRKPMSVLITNEPVEEVVRKTLLGRRVPRLFAQE